MGYTRDIIEVIDDGCTGNWSVGIVLVARITWSPGLLDKDYFEKIFYGLICRHLNKYVFLRGHVFFGRLPKSERDLRLVIAQRLKTRKVA